MLVPVTIFLWLPYDEPFVHFTRHACADTQVRTCISVTFYESEIVFSSYMYLYVHATQVCINLLLRACVSILRNYLYIVLICKRL